METHNKITLIQYTHLIICGSKYYLLEEIFNKTNKSLEQHRSLTDIFI